MGSSADGRSCGGSIPSCSTKSDHYRWTTRQHSFISRYTTAAPSIELHDARTDMLRRIARLPAEDDTSKPRCLSRSTVAGYRPFRRQRSSKTAWAMDRDEALHARRADTFHRQHGPLELFGMGGECLGSTCLLATAAALRNGGPTARNLNNEANSDSDNILPSKAGIPREGSRIGKGSSSR